MAEINKRDAPKDETKPPRSKGRQARKRAKRSKVSKPATRVVVMAEQLPRRSLDQALRVTRALRDQLAGGPASWADIASAMKIQASPQNKYYLWAAQAYNIVEKQEENCSLSELGRKILAPTTPNEAREATVQAVLTPVILSRFFTDYNGSPFPSEEHIGNILERKYSVPRERVEEAKNLIRENGLFAGILQQQADGATLVRLDPALTGIRHPATMPQASAEPPAEPGSVEAQPPTTDFDHLCFVITPVGEDESEERRHANMVLKNIVEPVATELGLVARRADQIDRSGIITQQIFEYVARARVCVADLSFSNPNAFYELGVRHMCKAPTVQIIRKGDKIPFDVSQGRTIKIDLSNVYSVIDSVESAKKELKQHLRHALSADYKGEDNPVNTYLPGVEIKIPR